MLIYLKNNWLEITAIIIAIISAFGAYMTWNLSYLLTHWPYVWAENFGYLDQNNIIVNPNFNIMLMVHLYETGE